MRKKGREKFRSNLEEVYSEKKLFFVCLRVANVDSWIDFIAVDVIDCVGVVTSDARLKRTTWCDWIMKDSLQLFACCAEDRMIHRRQGTIFSINLKLFSSLPLSLTCCHIWHFISVAVWILKRVMKKRREMRKGKLLLFWHRDTDRNLKNLFHLHSSLILNDTRIPFFLQFSIFPLLFLRQFEKWKCGLGIIKV